MSKKLSSGLFIWNHDITTCLILLYEAEPALYKVKSSSYHDRNARNKALQKICEELNKAHKTSLTISDVTKKIHGLRTTYFQEVNKLRKSECSGTSLDNVYVPKWWCFELLSFLRDHTSIVEPGSSNMSQTVQFEEESQEGQEEQEPEVLFDGDISDISLTSPTPTIPSRPDSASSGKEDLPPKKRQRIATPAENTQNVQSFFASAKNTLELIGAKQAPTKSKNSTFGQMLSQEMENITDEEILDNLKEEIMTALFRAKRKQREKNTTLRN